MKKNKIISLASILSIATTVIPVTSLSSCSQTKEATSWDYVKQGYYIPKNLPETRTYDKENEVLCKEYFQTIKDGHKNLYISDMLYAHNVIAYSYSQYEVDRNDSFIVKPDITNIEIINNEVRIDASLKISIKSALGDVNLEWIWQKMKANLYENVDTRMWELSYGYTNAEEYGLDDKWKLDAHIHIGTGKFDFVGIDKNSVNQDWFNTIIGHFSNFTTVNIWSLCYTYSSKSTHKSYTPIMHDFSDGKTYTPFYQPVEAKIDPGKDESTDHYAGIIRPHKNVFADDVLADITSDNLNTYKFKGKILVQTFDVVSIEEGGWRISFDIVYDGSIDGKRILSCIEMLDLKLCVQKVNNQNDNWYSCFDYEFDLQTRESTIWDDDEWQIGIYALGDSQKFVETYTPAAKELPIDKMTVEFITSLAFTNSLNSMSKVTVKE